ncbi:diadenylate cyclase CdaA [soil metagenome]
MDRILSIFQSLTKSDFIDVVALSLIFYVIFSLLQESRSFTALRGLVAVIVCGVLIWIVAKAANLNATTAFLEKSLILVVIVFTIIFQNDLRKAMTDFGQASIFRPFLQNTQFEVDEIIKAVIRLSERKVGALIAIERRNTLRPYIEVGTPIDAEVTAELLRTIFALQTPLHDGAVIIRGNRIAAAGCLLPLSENQKLSKDLGTRHRAGIGLTEETDAVVLICSEETGVISLAHDGRIERNETMESLRTKLKSFFEYQEEGDG